MKTSTRAMAMAFSLSILGACAMEGYEPGDDPVGDEEADEVALAVDDESAGNTDGEAAAAPKGGEAQVNFSCGRGYVTHEQGQLTCYGDSRCSYRAKVRCDNFPWFDYERLGSLQHPNSGSPSVGQCDSGDDAVSVWLNSYICPL